MKKFLGWILCYIFNDHDWTCKAEQGIDPDPVKQQLNLMGYFFEYAMPYCKRCGKIMANK